MDPEKIEARIKELELNVAEEIRKGQLKIRTIKTLNAELNKGAQKIMEWNSKIDTFREVLGKWRKKYVNVGIIQKTIVTIQNH